MADEHFFPGDYFSSDFSAPFLGSSGLDDAAAAMAFGALPWVVFDDDQQQLLLRADPFAATARFDSELSSLVSSPGIATAAGERGRGGEDEIGIGDLIGRLGSICNGGGSAGNSCYSTPLGSPPPAGRLSRVASSRSLGGGVAPAARPENAETANMMSPDTTGDHDDPSTAHPPPPKTAVAARKRKAPSAKGGDAKDEPSSPPAATAATKRPKVTDGGGAGEPEPAKDYIHVRARRGQATDSHSLAERVRREKISERMKLLQSLVPGCNKIAGKALMLDQIINYVQSLQRQVEFLSMKLSTMSPELSSAAGDGAGAGCRRRHTAAKNLAPAPACPSGDCQGPFPPAGDLFSVAAVHRHAGVDPRGAFQPRGGGWEEQGFGSMAAQQGGRRQ